MNPFRYTDPVSKAGLIGRNCEADELLETAVEGNNSRLVAPRRYGKTSLLMRVADDARKAGWIAVYVDFFGVLTLADIAQRIERAYEQQLDSRFGKWFVSMQRKMRPTLRVGGGPIPAALDVAVAPQEEAPLLERLALPRALYERDGQRCLIIFDEFQDVLTAQDCVDGVIRSEIQHHGAAASYIFAGSQVGMMRELFADRRRAFYGQANPVILPPLPLDELASFISNRFSEGQRDVGDALEPLLQLTQGHPQRSMLLAHALWDVTAPKTKAIIETWEQAYIRVMKGIRDELCAVWISLPASQRRALTAIADNSRRLYAANQVYGGSRGGTISLATQALEERGEIVADETTQTGYQVVDPLMAAWIREGRMATSQFAT